MADIDSEHDSVGTEENDHVSTKTDKNFNSKSIAVSAQKKVLSQLSTNKSVQKQFLDEEQNKLLNLLHDLSVQFLTIREGVDTLEDKKQREKESSHIKQRVHKVHKDLIKLVVKISVLSGNKQLNSDEIESMLNLRKLFHKFVLTLITYQQLPDCYNQDIIQRQMNNMKDLIFEIITRPLSEKSGCRVDNVFAFFTDGVFLDTIFKPNSPHKDVIAQISEILQNQLNNKII